MIHAIETIHNGYRFRSRKEARAAVFFDHMDVHYRYEEEGYNLDGLWYLPDFWLPKHQMFIEIKDQVSDGDIEKTGRLAVQSSCPVVMMRYADQQLAAFDPGNFCGLFFWAECPICHSLALLDDTDPEANKQAGFIGLWCPLCSQNKRLKIKIENLRYVISPRLQQAHIHAKQARFEHGETPRVPRGRPKNKQD